MKGRDDERRWQWGGEGGAMKWRKSVDMRNVPTACTGNESQHIQATKNRGTDQSDVNFDTASGDVASAMVRHDQVSIFFFHHPPRHAHLILVSVTSMLPSSICSYLNGHPWSESHHRVSLLTDCNAGRSPTLLTTTGFIAPTRV
jgi:hypothetical protein